ncbi:MAG: YdbH domain-containing protein, partial [Gammaproteobacteria bacterium]|nr:YdbH domain-containing protein [Gammaproteobacteria bacterium]
QANSTLTLSPIDLGPISFKLTQQLPLEVSTSSCLKFTALIAVNSAVCASELLKLPSVIQLSFPLKGRVDFDLKQPLQWQAKFENNGLELSNDTERVDIRLLGNQITPRKTQLNFLLSATSTRWPMANQMTVNARGQVNLEQQIILNIAELRFKALDVVGDDYKVKTLAFTSAKPFNIVVDSGELKPLVIEGTSSMADSEFKSLKLTTVTGKHIASYQQKKLQVDSSWIVDGVRLQSQDTADMTKNNILQLAGKWQLPAQALASLLKINSPVAKLITPELVLDPTLSGDMTYQLNFEQNRLTNAQATSTGNVAQFNATYNDVIMSDIRGDWQCEMQLTSQFSADCQLESRVNEIDAGIVLSKVNANYRFYTELGKSKLEVKKLNGQIFSGLFELTPLLVTDFDKVDFIVKLKNIKLGEIIELQNQPGIKVTGLLKGILPLQYSAQGFTVDQGIIESQNAGGHIEIKNNPTINQLRLSQPQLIFVLDALEDLTYSKLSSSINYQSDGWADIKVSIHGSNPDIERPIEFNYSHQENLLQLMKSLQIGDQISKQLEKIAD